MSFLQLNLYRHPPGATLDPKTAIEKLTASFPEVEVLPGDQLAASVLRIEELTAAERSKYPESPAHRLVESERRKAETFGPAYAFRLPIEGGGILRGSARRYDLTFLFDTPPPPTTRQRLIEFLKSFGVGQVRASRSDSRQTEVLFDMGGTTREANGAPRDADAERPASEPSETP